ncbi:NAD-dependent epimerase/dehydratase family protein [Sansalvadorimonas sp. 2012CJ34-2]|uniref:NAD-dependent epimerase/dehydratase family protein n=1 Tax=Parendozoicomonas callyspongiae TaxID=2942213 RepID=A0ABT0PK32_9GAMM|nr:NAD-dependent epimerase/dehydratase family protein [Sansalvadorimonas sp. 2012CJ34-2]MCL6270823.1 NAD-dependent epimerase/dehydratase family protein [Sansalvadorimonas sp. 2012CJ34-2]
MSITLITGATGTVGFNVVKSLLKQNRAVRVLVRDIEKAKKLLPQECEFIQGDITDIPSIEKAMTGCDVVHHAAGLPEQWFKNPDIFEQVNVAGTCNVLAAAKKLGVKKLVYTSTIDVFEGEAHQQFDESVIASEPKGTFYERSKQKADQCVVEAIKDGLDAVFIHPSAVYGPGPDIHHSVGVNTIITKVKNNDIPVLLPGGFPVVYSENVGEAHVAAESMPAGSRYIVSDQYVTLTELVGQIHSQLKIKRAVPKVMPVWVGKALAGAGEFIAGIINRSPLIAKGELTFLQWQAIPNGQKATKELGISYVGLQDGLNRTIELQKQGS